MWRSTRLIKTWILTCGSFCLCNSNGNLSEVTKALFSLIFFCFFKLCIYWNEPQIITKIVCDGVYNMSTNISILLCIDYSQAFFLSLMWSNVANNLIWEEKNVWFSPQDITKWASNNNMQCIQWKMKSLKTLLTNCHYNCINVKICG